jgi:glyoxylase-like metal-dependent hydrolase (beta-lactamase superfamily II)
MQIRQFEYKPLSHYSYALVSEKQMAVIDPDRDASLYYDYSAECGAKIVAVILTHPHADFVSSHLQLHEETGAPVYHSSEMGAEYPHRSFDEGDRLSIGEVELTAIHTPGHSPDSITIVARQDDEVALFTGDTLFVGDVGRPDLREKSGNTQAKREELAEMMYYTMQNKFSEIPDEAKIYPTHGAGSLCGKNMSDASSSTLGEQRKTNWAFQKQDKEDFVRELLDSQPFIPSYFGYNVDLNKAGAPNVRAAMGKVALRMEASAEGLIIDTRDEERFKAGHLPGSINIQAANEGHKFETWLGSIVRPGEPFSLVIASPREFDTILKRVTKIGYEEQLEKIITPDAKEFTSSADFDIEDFRQNPSKYTIVDIRNQSEINEGKFFNDAKEHPLNNLRETYKDIPTDKPVVVHCAGGYRSAAGSSILERELKGVAVFDLSDKIEEFK